MGSASTKKFIKQNLGVLTEESALTTSAGAADANKIPALNAIGVLDPSITNAKNTSSGAPDAGKLPQLDASGRLDASFLPVGIGADTGSVVASEALSAGELVNLWNNAGAFSMRKADGSTAGKEAHGFVLSAVAASASGAVYFEGTNTQVTGLAPGVQYLSATTPGKSTTTPPNGAGQVVQRVGFSVSATELNFDAGYPIVLA